MTATLAERLDATMVDEDLDFVVRRLVNREGMDEKLARKVLPEYIRFMSLRHITKEPLSPSDLVDEFWHAHILETEKYADFCARHWILRPSPLTGSRRDSRRGQPSSARPSLDRGALPRPRHRDLDAARDVQREIDWLRRVATNRARRNLTREISARPPS